MAVYVCRRCSHEAPQPWEALCPGCGGIYRWKKVGVDSTEQKTRSTFAAAIDFKRNYIETGVVGFDKTIGGGLVAGSAILMGGFRGAGKTTLCCMVCDAIARVKGRALYASAEESVQGVVAVAHRLGLKNEDVDVLGNQVTVEKVIEHMKQTKPFLTVFDSLQKYVSDLSGGQPGSIAQGKAVCSAILDHCRATKTCAIIVNQMTNQGELKGSTDAAHDVDTILVLGFPKDGDEDVPRGNGLRLLCIDGKNRNGDENVKTYWKMHGEGDERPGYLEHVPPRSRLVVHDEDDDDDDDAPAASRRGKYSKR